MNSVLLIGRLTKDMETRYTQSGTAKGTFTLAVDRNLSREKKAEAQANNQPTADFINIIAWGKVAEVLQEYLTKGKKVAVQGRIQTGSYEAQDGTRRYTTDIVASNIELLSYEENSQPARQKQQQQKEPTGDPFLDDDYDEMVPF